MAVDEIMQDESAEQAKAIRARLKVVAENAKRTQKLSDDFVSAIRYFEMQRDLIASMNNPGPLERSRMRQIASILEKSEARLDMMKAGNTLGLKVMKLFNITPLKLSERMSGVKGLINSPEAEEAMQAIIIDRLKDQQFAETIRSKQIAEEFSNTSTAKQLSKVSGKSNRYLAAAQKANDINISTIMLEETLRSAVSDKRSLAKASFDWLKKQEMAGGLTERESTRLDYFLRQKDVPNGPLDVENIKQAVNKPGYSIRNAFFKKLSGKRTRLSNLILGTGIVSVFMGNMPIAAAAGAAYLVPTLIPKPMSTIDYMKEYLKGSEKTMGALDSEIIEYQKTVMERQKQAIMESTQELTVQETVSEEAEIVDAIYKSQKVVQIRPVERPPLPATIKAENLSVLEQLNYGIYDMNRDKDEPEKVVGQEAHSQGM